MPYIRQIERDALEDRIAQVVEIILPPVDKTSNGNSDVEETDALQALYYFAVDLGYWYVEKFGVRYVNYNSVAGVFACVVKELKRIAAMHEGIGTFRKIFLARPNSRSEKQERIDDLVKNLIDTVEHVGQMNYILSVVCHRILLCLPDVSVATLCYVVDEAANSLYSQYTVAYENKKIAENGTISSWDFTIWEISKQVKDTI